MFNSVQVLCKLGAKAKHALPSDAVGTQALVVYSSLHIDSNKCTRATSVMHGDDLAAGSKKDFGGKHKTAAFTLSVIKLLCMLGSYSPTGGTGRGNLYVLRAGVKSAELAFGLQS